MRYVATKVAEVINFLDVWACSLDITVLSFQTVVVRILHFSGLVHRPTLPTSIVRAVVVTGPRVGYKKPSSLKDSRSEGQKNLWNANPPNSAKWWNLDIKTRVQSLRVQMPECVIYNRKWLCLGNKYFITSTSTVPVPVVQVPVQVPVLDMQVQVQVPVPENCT